MQLKPSTCKKIELGQWMFEASGVGISRAMGIDRGAEMFEVHENYGVERVDVRRTQSRQFKRKIGTAPTMCG